MESMDDYKEELEASLKKIRVGDVVTGTAYRTEPRRYHHRHGDA